MDRILSVSLRAKRSNLQFVRWGLLRAKIALAMTIIFLAACESVTIPRLEDTPASTPAPIATQSAPTQIPPTPTPDLPEGGAIAIGVVGNANLEMNVMPAFLHDAIFDSLLQIDPTNGSLKPALAMTYTVSSDAATFTFHLRDDVRWHNGDALTAADVVATISAFASPNFRGTPVTDFGSGMRVSAPDNQTVQLTFGEGYCPALTSISTLKILPRAVATSANFPRLTPAQMIGTGALKFVARNNSDFTLERNLDYFRSAPHIESWTLRVFADSAALRAAFANQQLDLMPATSTEYAAIKNTPDAKLIALDASEFIALLFNADTIPLNEARVRQALNYAIDRDALVNDFPGQTRRLDIPALAGFWASNGNLPRYGFDPAKAKQMLADAGWTNSGNGILQKNGKPLKLDLWSEADHPLLEPLAFRLREQFAAVGIQAQMQLNDRPGWMTRAFQHRFDLLLVSRKIPLDPDQRWYWQANQNEKGNGMNFGSYANPRVDALIRDSLRANACDANARTTAFAEINRNLLIDAPAAFLLAPKRYWLARDRVLGFAPSSFAGDFWNLQAWGIKP